MTIDARARTIAEHLAAEVDRLDTDSVTATATASQSARHTPACVGTHDEATIDELADETERSYRPGSSICEMEGDRFQLSIYAFEDEVDAMLNPFVTAA